MINPKELLFAVDENNQPIEPVERWKAHKDGIWHRNAHIWVIDSNNRVLCNQRSMKKDTHPGKWEAFLGGHVLTGMDSSDAAVLELKEEVGIAVQKKDLIFYKVWKYSSSSNNEFIYIYSYRFNGDQKIVLEKDEIAQIEWIDFEKLKIDIFAAPRWSNPPYLKEFFMDLNLKNPGK